MAVPLPGTSLRHVNIVAQLLMISINCCPANMEKNKQTNFWHVWLSCAWLHSGTNCIPYVSSLVRQCKWPSLSRKIVEIQKFCYHGNVTSLLFGKWARAPPPRRLSGKNKTRPDRAAEIGAIFCRVFLKQASGVKGRRDMHVYTCSSHPVSCISHKQRSKWKKSARKL